MRVLLDTHAWLWWLTDDDELPASARRLIADPTTVVHVSAATVWEAVIKAGLGRLELGATDLAAEIAADGFTELAVTGQHAWEVRQLPSHHRDPFDRLLVAQSRVEGLALVTVDAALAAYDVDTIAW